MIVMKHMNEALSGFGDDKQISPAFSRSFPALKRGSKGGDVKEVQKLPGLQAINERKENEPHK